MLVILHNIRSLYNVGSIFRTADAAGIEKIYLCGITPKPIDEIWEKQGAPTRKKSIQSTHDKKKTIRYYRIHYPIRRSSDRIVKKKKIVLVLGNEIKGLPQSILKRADKILEIPMKGKKESLNVAVAFGIVAFSLSIKNKKFQLLL